MFYDIIALNNLVAAWREFRRGKRGKPDVQTFERRLEDRVFALHSELRNKSYRHGSYERFHLFDPKHRVIHKAEVKDRVVHHALYRVLAPVFEQSFICDSYSCRLDKGTIAAVERLGRFARGVSRNYRFPCWALKCDIRKFFDSINHAILLQFLSRRVKDSDTLWLLREIVKSFNKDNVFEREKKGVPIGNLTSQLFANIYLNEFDHFIKEELRVKYYIRYTDDFVMLHSNPIALVSLLPAMRGFLKKYLGLELHPRKIVLRKLSQGIDFLGYVIFPHYRVLRARTKARMFQYLEERVRNDFAGIESYLGLLSHGHSYALAKQVREQTYFNECWQCGIMHPF